VCGQSGRQLDTRQEATCGCRPASCHKTAFSRDRVVRSILPGNRATPRDTVSGWRWPPQCGESILRATSEALTSLYTRRRIARDERSPLPFSRRCESCRPHGAPEALQSHAARCTCKQLWLSLDVPHAASSCTCKQPCVAVPQSWGVPHQPTRTRTFAPRAEILRNSPNLPRNVLAL
jgi:hypothetical protein